jgi:hypothetical protein
MRILIDIGHPAHVHLFKNFAKEMMKNGHAVLFSARDKDVAIKLLDAYELPYEKRGKGYSGIKKAIGMFAIDWKIIKIAKRFKPDVMIGASGNCYIAQAAWLLGVKSIIFEDTDLMIWQFRLMKPFADQIVTPKGFSIDLGKKHVRYNGFKELSYLHPNWFSEEKIKGLKKPYVLMRFVSFAAQHDSGKGGFSLEWKIKFAKELAKHAHVYITSEAEMPKELERFRLKLAPEKMHSVMKGARLYVGDSQTMATEAACLGVPVVRCNEFVGEMSNFDELERKYKLMFSIKDPKKALAKALALVTDKDALATWEKRRKKLFEDKIDLTRFMIELVTKRDERINIVYHTKEGEKNLGGTSSYILDLKKHMKLNIVPGDSRSSLRYFLSLFPKKPEGIIAAQNVLYALRFIFSKKLVVTIHGDDATAIERKKGKVVGWVYSIIERMVLFRARRVIFVSDDIKKRYLKRYPALKDKARVIHIGVDTTIFKPKNVDHKEVSKKHRVKIGAKEKVLLYCGRLRKDKNVDQIIKAFLLAKEKDKGLKLLIAGDGPEKDILLHAEGIYYLGAQSRQELVDLYNIADAAVLFSEYESGPLVVQEAMACGTPVVTVPVGRVNEFVKNRYCGRIVKPDVKAFSSAILEVLRIPKDQAERECRSAAYGFSFDKTLEETKKIYEEII